MLVNGKLGRQCVRFNVKVLKARVTVALLTMLSIGILKRCVRLVSDGALLNRFTMFLTRTRLVLLVVLYNS